MHLCINNKHYELNFSHVLHMQLYYDVSIATNLTAKKSIPHSLHKSNTHWV